MSQQLAPHVRGAIQAGLGRAGAGQAKPAPAARPTAPHVQAAISAVQAKPAPGPGLPPRPAVAPHVQRAVAACQPKLPPARPALAVHAQAALAPPRPAPVRPCPAPPVALVQPMRKRKATNDGNIKKKKKRRIGEGDGDSEDDDFEPGKEIPVDLSLMQEESTKRKRPSKIKNMETIYRRDVRRAKSPDIDEQTIRRRREKKAKKENKQKKTLMVDSDSPLTKHFKVSCSRCNEYIRMDSKYRELGVRIQGEPKVPPLGHRVDYVEYEDRLFERSEEVDEKYRSAYLSLGAWDPRNVLYEHFDCNSEAPKRSGSTSGGTQYVDNHHDEWMRHAKTWVKKGELPDFFPQDGDSS